MSNNRQRKILITPISKNKKSSPPCSKTDWEEQEQRKRNNQQMMWDDSKNNGSQIGDILIVWRHKCRVSFHLIEDIKKPEKRLPSWSNNVGQTKRNVLFISPEFASMNWEEWLKNGGWTRVMGTSAFKKNERQILQKINNYIPKINNKLFIAWNKWKDNTSNRNFIDSEGGYTDGLFNRIHTNISYINDNIKSFMCDIRDIDNDIEDEINDENIQYIISTKGKIENR